VFSSLELAKAAIANEIQTDKKLNPNSLQSYQQKEINYTIKTAKMDQRVI